MPTMILHKENDGIEAPKVISKSNEKNGAITRSLRLVFLGCEDKPPYGPTEHTATLFLELFSQTLTECYPNESWSVSITIHRVQLGEYPTTKNWDEYDGILIGGSFAAAYDQDQWIETLKQVIQSEIVAKQRPTMGICFGHQIMAHSFDSGLAQAHSKGPRSGRFAMGVTKAGKSLFSGKENVELFYTHGDMVQDLPPCAVALGQEGDTLPVQSAAYFATEEDAKQFQSGSTTTVKPFAITFQAHPEYSVSPELGMKFTLGRIMDVQAEKGMIEQDVIDKAKVDAASNYDRVHRQSKDAFIASARALGWFA